MPIDYQLIEADSKTKSEWFQSKHSVNKTYSLFTKKATFEPVALLNMK